MEQMFEYEIGGKKYTQSRMTMGQVRQMVQALKGITLPSNMESPEGIGHLVQVLGEKLPHCIAIVLREEGKHLKDKNLEALMSEIEFEMYPEVGLKVVEDFFTCNPIASLLNMVMSTVDRVVARVEDSTNSLKSPSSSSQEGI